MNNKLDGRTLIYICINIYRCMYFVRGGFASDKNGGPEQPIAPRAALPDSTRLNNVNYCVSCRRAELPTVPSPAVRL